LSVCASARKAAGRHEIACVGISTGQVELELSADDGQQHHPSNADHAKRRQCGGAEVERIKKSAHPAAVAYLRKASTSCLPSAPAFSSHSLQHHIPDLLHVGLELRRGRQDLHAVGLELVQGLAIGLLAGRQSARLRIGSGLEQGILAWPLVQRIEGLLVDQSPRSWGAMPGCRTST
jgi:hypothetical protein